jgi:GDSL-like Lipase/Acylhydrolase family
MIPACCRRNPRIHSTLWAGLVCVLVAHTVRADLVLTDYTSTRPLKILPVGDSITDDCAIDGAWRLYLEPLLLSNGYAFTNLGRWISSGAPGFTRTRHEGICGEVIAFPGMFGWHGYPTLSNYALGTVADALVGNTPDLVLIDLGVNDMGYGRNPWLVATNHMAALLDLIFARAPSAHIIVGKPTSITTASISSPPYSTYGTNMPIFCAALQTLANARSAQGQKVSVADLFSAVSPSLLQSDGTHPNAAGFNAMAKEWQFRIAAITVRTDRVVTPFIAAGATWKYSDQGLDLGTNWVQPPFDDSGWTEGPARLGYNVPGLTTTVNFGSASTNKFITTYFRRTFVPPANLHYTNLNLRLNRADGAIVWLNGRELMRVNLSPGPISYLNRATVSVTGDAMHNYYPTSLPIPFLPSGTNVVAVEIHRFSASGPSLSFDLELFGLGEYGPRLSASLHGTDFTVRWPATNHAGFTLVSGTNLDQPGAWSPRGGPYLLNGSSYEYREPMIPSLTANFFALRYAGVPATGPTLSWVLGSNALGLSWPIDFAGFNLETSTGLPPAAAWQTVAGPYPLSNGFFGMSVSRTTNAQGFFRLRKLVP